MAIPLRNNNDLFTYADYLTWPDNERWEIIEGMPIDMTPAPSTKHQKISMDLSTLINTFIKKKGGNCSVFAAPFDVTLPGDLSNEETITVVQPDISIICDPRKLDEKGCKGAPDIIIEILSPTTAQIDHKLKLQLYEKYKVKEYWLIHPTDQILWAYQMEENGKYRRAGIYAKDDVIPLSLQGNTLEIKLAEIF